MLAGLGLTAIAALWIANAVLCRVVWARLDLAAIDPGPPPPPLSSLSAEGCRPCHPAQYADWSRSAMGRAMTDPIFLADYEHQGELFVCLFCHAPLAAQQPLRVSGLATVRPLRPRAQPNPGFDPALQREGVTCVACHLRDGVITGPDEVTAPHPTRADPTFADPSLCEGCHQVAVPPLTRLDRPIADTHGEWKRWQQATGRTESCADCHMPDRRHTWPGAFDAPLLRAGLDVSVAAEDDRVLVTLHNKAGHRFPTADPARALVVRLGEHEVVLARRVPLPKMVDLGDTTLGPDEVRTISLPRDDNATHVEVVMQPVRFLPVAPEPVEILIFSSSLPRSTSRRRSRAGRPSASDAP